MPNPSNPFGVKGVSIFFLVRHYFTNMITVIASQPDFRLCFRR